MRLVHAPAELKASLEGASSEAERSFGDAEVYQRDFAVRLDNLPRDLEATHVNLNDGTLEGMRHRQGSLFSVQYHPEASAGPHDSSYLFEQFQKSMG